MANVFSKDYWTKDTSLEDRKTQGKFLYHLADNLIGFEDEYESRGERFGKGIKDAIDKTSSDPYGTIKSVASEATDTLSKVRRGPLAYAKEDVAVGAIPEEQWNAMEEEWLTDVMSLSAAPMAPNAGKLSKLDLDTTTIFGGSSATDPGYTRSGAKAPLSRGKDNLPRFEISDNEAGIVSKNIPVVDNVRKADPKSFATLGDTLVHDELFYQYPEMKDVKIVFATELGDNSYGAYGSKHNTIYLNPKLDPERQLDTVLHEIQHAVQDVEKFDAGASLDHPEVIQRIREGRLWQEEVNSNERKLKKFNEYAKFTPQLARNVSNELDSIFKGQGIDPATVLNTKVGSKEYRKLASKVKQFEPLKDKYIGSIFELRQGLESVANSDNYQDNMMTLRNYSFTLEDLSSSIPEVGKHVKDFAKGREGDFWDFFRPIGLLTYEDTDPLSRYGRNVHAYKTRSGEAEARNVEARRKLTPEERFVSEPETTEDYPRDEQWNVPRGYPTLDTQTKEVFDAER